MRLSLKFSLSVVLGATLVCGVTGAADPPSERVKVEGFAVVRVAHNGGASYGKMRVEPVDGGSDIYLFGPVSGRDENPATYAGWLDPGTYRFLRMEDASSWGLGTLYTSLEFEGFELPTFTVEAGGLVDLGTWLVQPIGDRVAIALLDDAGAFGQGRGNKRLDEAAAAFTAPPTRWNGAAVWSAGASASELLEASKRATGIMRPPQFDDEGNAYFASVLGQVVRRTSRGEWRNLDTGTLDSLNSLVIDGANIYASAEQHRLLQSADGGVTWASAEVPVDGNVTAIARLPNGDFIAAIAATDDDDTQLLRGPDLLALPPTPWKTLETGATPSHLVPTALAGPVKDRLIVWTNPRSLYVYDIPTDSWTSSRGKRLLGELYVNGPAGLVYSAAPMSSEAVSVGVRLIDGLISSDGGTSWQSVELGRHNGYGFKDRMNGIAIGVSVFGGQNWVETTSDGGTTWKRLEKEMPGFCDAVQYLPPTDELVCMTSSGRILSTRTGEEWTTERNGL